MQVSNNYFGKLKFNNFVNSDICDGLDYLDSGLCMADLYIRREHLEEVRKSRRLERLTFINFLKCQDRKKKVLNEI